MFNGKYYAMTKQILFAAYTESMDYLAQLFIEAKRTIDHLEGDEFKAEWAKLLEKHQLKAAHYATEVAATSIEAMIRKSQFEKDRSIPGNFYQQEELYRVMDPTYLYCVIFYIICGKKASPAKAMRAGAEIGMMKKTWLRMWETNYSANEPLYMGNDHEPLSY